MVAAGMEPLVMPSNVARVVKMTPALAVAAITKSQAAVMCIDVIIRKFTARY
jgi:hypothetical protein